MQLQTNYNKKKQVKMQKFNLFFYNSDITLAKAKLQHYFKRNSKNYGENK